MRDERAAIHPRIKKMRPLEDISGRDDSAQFGPSSAHGDAGGGLTLDYPRGRCPVITATLRKLKIMTDNAAATIIE
jgi:hypothetical protein